MKRTACSSISPYLIEGIKAVVEPSPNPLFGQKRMVYGNKFTDGGCLKIEADEYASVPAECLPYVRRLAGAREILYGERRWCLWLYDAPKEVLSCPFVADRVERRKSFLMRSAAQTTRKFALSHPELPMSPAPVRDVPCIAMPAITSTAREYIPPVFLDADTVASNKVYLVPNGTLADFALMSSKMHMLWNSLLCNRLRAGGYSYSNTLCWHTFPVPETVSKQADEIEHIGREILKQRESCGQALAHLYDPDRMPKELRRAHGILDCAVDRLYRPDGFKSNEDRLRHLLRMHEDKTSGSTLEKWL